MLRSLLPLQKYNVPQPPEVPNWLAERVMHTLTGIRAKNVAQKNATGKIRPPGNLRGTFKNLKRNYNSYGPRKQRKSRRRKARTRRFPR